jgi:hypothetical protein
MQQAWVYGYKFNICGIGLCHEQPQHPPARDTFYIRACTNEANSFSEIQAGSIMQNMHKLFYRNNISLWHTSTHRWAGFDLTEGLKSSILWQLIEPQTKQSDDFSDWVCLLIIHDTAGWCLPLAAYFTWSMVGMERAGATQTKECTISEDTETWNMYHRLNWCKQALVWDTLVIKHVSLGHTYINHYNDTCITLTLTLTLVLFQQPQSSCLIRQLTQTMSP